MNAGAVPNAIRFNAPANVALKSGDRVVVHVLKNLIGQKWAVALQGRVFPAKTDLPLSPGQRLAAVVQRDGSRIVLRVEPNSSAGATRVPDLGDQALSRLVAAALMRDGNPLTEPAMRAVYTRTARSMLPRNKTARALSVLLEKGIDLESSGVDDLLELILFEEAGDREGYRRRRPPWTVQDVAQAVRARVEETAEEGALPLFNALPGRNGSWIAVPFLFAAEGGGEIPGVIRLFVRNRRAERLVVDVRARRRWAFLIVPQRGRKRVTVFCGDASAHKGAGRKLRLLKAKLQNRGVDFDDSIRDIGAFDGFSAEWEDTSAGVDVYG